MAHPVYQYQPLATETSIRILVLHPADRFAAQLEVCFKHLDRHAPYDLDISGHYEAVSYCWGDPNFSHSVRFSSPTSQLPITVNVDSMLRHLRKPHKAKHLWVDALCVNQTNAEEKSSQVRSMGGIFQAATKVDVWLGPDASCGVEKVFAYFKKLVNKHEYQESGVPSVLLNHFVTTDLTFREALEQLLSNPWFRRRWILQEITVSLVSPGSPGIRKATSIRIVKKPLHTLHLCRNTAAMAKAVTAVFADSSIERVCDGAIATSLLVAVKAYTVTVLLDQATVSLAR